MSPDMDRAPALTTSTEATDDPSRQRKSTADVALFADGADHLVIAGPRRGSPPMGVNASIKGTTATWDQARRVWVIAVDDVPALVANMRARGLVVEKAIKPWVISHDVRTPDPLPECRACATPYKRLGVVPRHCVKCGDRLELQVIRTLAEVQEHALTPCPSCRVAVDRSSLFCGECGTAVDHG
jgi:hypothetical protein